MLGKLIKYDFKALNRSLIAIHIMLLITAALGRFLFVERLIKNSGGLSDMGMVIMTLLILLYVILFMTALFGTLLVISIHFYKNLYSDEGYLTHTLPVSRGRLLIAKTVSGSVWMLIDVVLVIMSVLILVLYQPMVREFSAHKDEVLIAMGFPSTVGYGKIISLIIVLFVVSAVANVMMLYVSIAVGQLFSNHRVMGAIAAYFSINTILSVVSGVVGAAYSVSVITNAVDETFMYQLYSKTYIFGIVLELILAVGFYVVTYLLMQKKLNLN